MSSQFRHKISVFFRISEIKTDFFLFFIKNSAVRSHNSSFIVNFAAKKTDKSSNYFPSVNDRWLSN